MWGLPVGLILLAISAASAHGQARDHAAWWVQAGLGYAGASGGYGEVLDNGGLFDFSLARASGSWRFGGGIQFGGLGMASPYGDELEWSRLEVFGSVRRVFHLPGDVRPYLELRPAAVRVQSRSALFYDIPPEDVAAGHDATPESNGFGLTVRPGVEIGLTNGFGVDLAASYSRYRTSEYDLAQVGMAPASTGGEWGLRAGFSWQPLWQPEGGGPVVVDAWGVPRSWGWASAEILGINFGVSMLNSYVRDESTWPVTPQSFQSNLSSGWKFDDNKFGTNQLIHPLNGAAYFNSGRSNGIDFWGSTVVAAAGAFMWECCGETQNMSWNDMLSTTIGGIASGEIAYRASSMVLDNRARGGDRIWREAASFVIDPIRGLNRLLSGRAWRQAGNPIDPYDRRPPRLISQVNAGLRVMGEGTSITDNTKRFGFLEMSLIYGDPFENTRRRPFDRFDAYIEISGGSGGGIDRLQVRGDLWSTPLGDASAAETRHTFAVVHDFDYIDNEAYEFGGQGLGVALFSRFGSFERRFVTRLSVTGILGAAVNSDYAFLADVPGDRGVRNYDYGTGLGVNFEGLIFEEARTTARVDYRYTSMIVFNGSLSNPTSGILDFGSDARHTIHRAGAEVLVAISDAFSVGVQGNVFFRSSTYDSPELLPRRQNNPELKVYLSRSWR